jgi:hypothetical protein|tara:strand:+ start:451 stop:753 length:303 start_codon:yes stop_codon:yes gene_type:complete
LDKKHAKKIKRAAKKKKEKKLAQEQDQKMRNQMNMFDRLPKVCNTCDEVFPKTREAHMSWKVVVRNEEQQVRLFCPACLDKAAKLVEEQDATEQETEEAT